MDDHAMQKRLKLRRDYFMNNRIAPRVFISYTRSDGEEFAHRLRKRLEQENIPLWQDRVGMEGGRDWWQQITEALDQVEFMVLIMTPNALASETVRKEWRYARQEGVCVYPVIYDPYLDFSTLRNNPGLPPDQPEGSAAPKLEFSVLPRWMRKVHFYDLKHEWTKFVNDLNTRCSQQRVPFNIEDVPEGFIKRPTLFKEICNHLIDGNGNPIPSIVALCGAGGYGKTSMALYVCNDDEIQTVFNDGILLVHLGEDPGDLIGHIQDIIYTISGERPGFMGIEAATARMMELLSERDILILIDDVWNSYHLKPFIQAGKRCARLITTCNLDTLPKTAINKIDVSKMLPEEATNLLGAGLPQEEKDALRS
ncbi:TIR domain-containing protein, partial [bacterium]|nr:TIR domain-containing protein [bacterium]